MSDRWFGGVWMILVAGLLATTQVYARELPDFSELVEANSPVVVNISTTQKVKQNAGGLPPGMEMPNLPEDSPFNDLFKHFFGEGGEGAPEEFDAKSLGSGFIISADGYVLTNNHVVKDAEEIIVRLSDRRELEAKVIGTDERSDVALLKIEADDLPVAHLGKAENLKVGEWVLAIGSPFGFDSTATTGIVSAKGRALPRENYVPFIQTDVAINPGNSGGPLFNMDGEVVGINSQIFSRTGGYMGLSFAIPIEVAMDVAEQIKSKGHVTRGWLGVLIQDVTRELAQSFGMKKPMGALVSKVLPDSPGAKGGIQVGDVILEFNGREVNNSANLPPIVGSTPVGKEIQVKVLRNGEVQMLNLTLGELKEEDKEIVAAVGPKSTTNSRLGVGTSEVPKEIRDALELKEGGVIVSALDNGAAAKAGVRKGDVIIMFNGVRVENGKQFGELVDKAQTGAVVPVLVQREGGPTFLAIKIPGKKG
ncbi:MAG: DegQ family serine endoprotease [Gammaproteobacteria bacterium]|nr:DegQ family serine endoprotease [Gammaproteobacteria bacterium]